MSCFNFKVDFAFHLGTSETLVHCSQVLQCGHTGITIMTFLVFAPVKPASYINSLFTTAISISGTLLFWHKYL